MKRTYYYAHYKETYGFCVYYVTASKCVTLYSGIPDEDDAVKLEGILNRMEEYAVRVGV